MAPNRSPACARFILTKKCWNATPFQSRIDPITFDGCTNTGTSAAGTIWMPGSPRASGHSNEKLKEEGQVDWKLEQASKAVALYHRMLSDRAASFNTRPTGGDAAAADPSGSQRVTPRSSGAQETNRQARRSRPLPGVPPPATGFHPGYDTASDRPQGSRLVPAPHSPASDQARAPQPLNRSHRPDSGAALATSSSPLPAINGHPSGQAPGASWVWVFEGLKSAIAVRHYSQKTFHAYRHWPRKFQAFVHSKDPALADMEDVKAFLSTLATKPALGRLSPFARQHLTGSLRDIPAARPLGRGQPV